ncbi:MAG: hypothetical protein Q9208_000594 [Pyrenodesmia sp. 3 TL-2023]
MTPSSILITTPPSFQTRRIATGTGPSTTSKSDYPGILIPEDDSQPKTDATQLHEDGNAEVPNIHTQLPSASVVSQNYPEPSVTGTSGAANEAGSDDQDAASGQGGAGDTSPQPNQAPGDPDPTMIPASRPAPAPQPFMNAGESTTKDPALQSIIGSRTLTPGAPGSTIDGTLVSLQPSATALVVGSSTKLLADSPKQSMLTFNGVSFSPGPGSDLVIGTQAIAAGAPAVTISGKAISLAAGGTAIAVGPSTMPLAVPAAQEIVTANGLSFSRGSGSNLVIGTETINPGAPAVTVSGTPVSLALDGTAIVVGSSTESLPAAPTQSIVTAGPFTFKRGSGSDFVIGTQTITAGAAAVTISGTPVSLPVDGTAVVLDASTIPLLGPTPATTPAPTTAPIILDINGIPLTALSESNYIVDSQTLIPGKPAITVNGTPVSLAIGGTAVVAGDSTVQLSTAIATPSVLDINGVLLTAVSGSSNYVIGSQTLVPGKPAITVNGAPVSLAASATAVVSGGLTIPLLGAATTPAVLAINGNSYTGISGPNFLTDSQTLIPGGPAITISGTPIPLLPGATGVVIGGSTFPFPNPSTTSPPVLTINGDRYTQMSGSSFLIGSQTLIPGGPAITVSGTPISLPLDATAVVVGGSTVPIPRPTSTPVVLEIDGQSFTQISGSGFLIGSQTLLPGGAAITVNGTLVSLGAAATNLVVGTQTEPLTTSRGLGEIIMGGFSNGGPGVPVATNTSSVVGFIGGTCRGVERRLGGMCVGAVLGCILAYLF